MSKMLLKLLQASLIPKFSWGDIPWPPLSGEGDRRWKEEGCAKAVGGMDAPAIQSMLLHDYRK